MENPGENALKIENAPKTPAPPCPACASRKVKKTGFSRYGKQRFLCQDCRRSFCQDPIDRSTEPKRKAQILAACQERMSQRGIARVFGVSRNTVIKWLKKSPSSLSPEEDLGQSQQA